MSKIGVRMPREYSDEFDILRQNRVETSYYKYGTAADNFGMRLCNALESCNLCIQKYVHTGNTEYLCDASNYLMFEFMYPRHKNAHFRATGDGESAGVSGTPVKQMYNELERIPDFPQSTVERVGKFAEGGGFVANGKEN